MEQIQVLSLNDFNNLVYREHISLKNVIFWVGCGIDSLEPTNLPLASELLEKLLLKTCGQLSFKLLNTWQTIKKEIDKLNIVENEFASIPRMESIIEQFLLCEQHMKVKHAILPVIQCFKDAPPNKNHFSLASAISCGANVVTTNYTLCIQKAFSLLNEGYEFNLCQHINDSLTYIFQSNCPEAGAIYHIHGIATEESQIGASLGKVKNKLPQIMLDKIENWIQEKKIFIFCGYSGSDAFDVNRYFLSAENSYSGATGIFIRHSNVKNDEQPQKLPIREKEQILLRVFQNKFIVEANTSKLLEEFIGSKETVEFEKFCWEKKCQTAKYPSKFHKNLLIQLCSFLGINVKLIIGEDWLPNKVEQDCYSPWYTDYPCMTMARLQEDYTLIAQFGQKLKQYENKDIMNREMRAAYRKYDICTQQEVDRDYEFVSLAIKSNLPVDWNLSASINQHTDYIISEILLCQTRDELHFKRNCFKEMALKILETCQMIILHNYDLVIEMNQLHLALRDAAVLQSIAVSDYSKAKKLLKQSTYYYVEVSSIDGIIGNLNVAQIICFMEYLESGKNELHDDAYGYYRAVRRICDYTRFRRHEQIANITLEFMNRLC